MAPSQRSPGGDPLDHQCGRTPPSGHEASPQSGRPFLDPPNPGPQDSPQGPNPRAHWGPERGPASPLPAPAAPLWVVAPGTWGAGETRPGTGQPGGQAWSTLRAAGPGQTVQLPLTSESRGPEAGPSGSCPPPPRPLRPHREAERWRAGRGPPGRAAPGPRSRRPLTPPASCCVFTCSGSSSPGLGGEGAGGGRSGS